MVSVFKMTRKKSSLPICDLSFDFEWTPLNRIFFSQCIQDSDEEEGLSSQKKKKLKRKSFSSKNIKKNYIVYESASSESDVPASNEFDSAEEFKKKVKRKRSGRKRKRIVQQSRPSEEQSSDEQRFVHCSEVRIEEEKVCDECELCSDPEMHDSEVDSSYKEVSLEEEKVYDECKLCSDPEIHNSEVDSSHKEVTVEGEKVYDECEPCADPELHNSEVDSSHEELHSDVRLEGEKVYDECEPCAYPELHNSEVDSSQEEPRADVRLEREKVYDECEPRADPELHNSEVDSSDEELRADVNMLPQASRKHSSDDSDYELFSSSEYTNTDDGSSDSWSQEASRQQRKNKKSIKWTVKPLKKKISELSEYEKMVQKNRDEKMVFLKALKIIKVKEDSQGAVKDLKHKPVKKRKKRKTFTEKGDQRDVETEKILRQSFRLKSLLNKQEETIASSQSSVVNKKSPNDLLFEEVAKDNDVYHDFISDCSEPNFVVSKLFDSGYASHFEKMEFQPSLTTPISCYPITSMAIHESLEKIIICSGNQKGEIIFCYLNSDVDICTFQPHQQTVNTLKFHPYFPNMLISSSADGNIYSGNFEKNIFSLVFKGRSCYHFDFLSPTSYIVAHGNGYVSIVDHRSQRQTFEKRHKCSEDIVKTVDLHPVDKNYFISAHQKGAVKLWDLRKLQDEPVIDVNCNGEMISSFFSPVTGNSVLVTLYDAICLLDRSSLNEEVKMERIGKKIWTPIHATWLPNTDNALAFGRYSKIEIFDDKLNNIFNFTNEHFKTVGVINVFHSSLPFLASATKSRIFIFSEIE